MRKTLPIFFFVLILSICSASAQDEDINLETLPTQLGNAWGISPFAAGLFLSTLVSVILIFPTILATRETDVGGIAVLIVGLGCMGFSIAIGWIPYWIMLLTVLLVSSVWAALITKGL